MFPLVSRRNKSLILAIVIAVVVNIILFTRTLRPAKELEIERIAFPEMQSQIEQIINELSQESLADSLKKLSEPDLYFLPSVLTVGGGGHVLSFPLPQEAGDIDFKRIISNRRFLKIYEEMVSLKKEESARIITEELNATLKEYDKLYDNYLDENERHFLKTAPLAPGGPVFQISKSKSGSSTLVGTRFKILSLVILAGGLNLEDCNPVVRSIVSQAKKQETTVISWQDRCQFIFLWETLMKASLYSRQILMLGMIGTSDTVALSKMPLKKYKEKIRLESMPGFRAPATPFDQSAIFAQVRKKINDNAVLRIPQLDSVADEDIDGALNVGEGSERGTN